MADAKHEASLDAVLDAMVAARGEGKKEKVGVEEFEKVLDSTPLFMRETPKDTEGDYVLEALKSLVFEGEGDEVSLNFKNHGNELYAQKSYRDAATAYGQGLDAGPQDAALRVSLLNNRAAANLALKNYRAVLGDTSAIIALAAARKPPSDPPGKALYRASQALIGLEKWDEAGDAIERGRKLWTEGANQKVWEVLERQVSAGKRRVFERAERERRKTLLSMAEQRAVVERGLIPVKTSQPPDNPEPLHFETVEDVPLYPPEEAEKWAPPFPHTPMVFPVVLYYPQHSTSDFITAFNENHSFDDHLGAIFPASPSSTSPPWSEWDQAHEFYASNLAVYVETSQKRLLKVGKEITLREVITKAVKSASDGKPRDGIPLRDGLLSFVVVAKGKGEREWIESFKRARDS